MKHYAKGKCAICYRKALNKKKSSQLQTSEKNESNELSMKNIDPDNKN